ncbi:MAG: hypothetical protein GKS00_21200 [Alphaproteobacteria bacterium]|nr:hypothetical protein [Alphaproteobacteria bacterium]
MEAERIDAIKAIIGQIDSLSVAVNSHLEAFRSKAEEQEDDDTEQHLEFAFAELRAACHELSEVTKCAREHA